MKKILAIGASSNSQSINKQLANYAASLVEGAEVNLLDLNDFEMMIYSIDREEAMGVPDLAVEFRQHILDADGLILSFAEHNGTYTTAFKNILDWISRLEKPTFAQKPTILMATSPGGNGAATVLDAAAAGLPYLGINLIGKYSLPKFYENFLEGGLKPSDKKDELLKVIKEFEKSL